MRRAQATAGVFSMGLIGLMSLMSLVAPLARAQTDTNANPAAPADAAPAPATAQPSSPAPSYFAPTVTPQAATPGSGAKGQEDIADIHPPFFFLHSWFWLWLALAVAAVLALLWLVWKGIKRSPFLSPKSAYELALEKLEQARALLREEEPVPYAVAVSEAVRSYLGQRYQSPSTRRTTEEFLRLMEADPTSPLAEHRELLRNFLQACDLVKFARYQPTQAELEEVHQRALTFVQATKPLPENATKGATP